MSVLSPPAPRLAERLSGPFWVAAAGPCLSHFRSVANGQWNRLPETCPALCGDSAGVEHSSFVLALSRECGRSRPSALTGKSNFPEPQTSSLDLRLGTSLTSDRPDALLPTHVLGLLICPETPLSSSSTPESSGSVCHRVCPHLLTLTERLRF